MASQVLELKFKKSTKGTHVYEDEHDDAAIPTVYIKRHALPTKPPETVKVTIEYDVPSV